MKKYVKIFIIFLDSNQSIFIQTILCKDHDYCYVEIPDEVNRILKYNYGGKSMKATFIVYSDLECLLKKTHSCQNNSEQSDTEKNYA